MSAAARLKSLRAVRGARRSGSFQSSGDYPWTMRQPHVRFTYLRWLCGSAVSVLRRRCCCRQGARGAIGLFRCIRAAICMASPYHYWADRALPAVHADPVRPLGSLPLRHAMVVVWLLFTVMLCMAEPLFLHRWLDACAKAKPNATFRLVEWMHWLLLTLGAITILGTVAGSHGLLL